MRASSRSATSPSHGTIVEQSVVAQLSQRDSVSSGETLDAWYDLAGVKHFWFELRLLAFLRLLRRTGVELAPLRLLEIGCGTGTVLEQLEQAAGITADGCDLNLPALTRASDKVKGKLMFYDITERESSLAGAYGGVILFDVLEHLDDVPGFLAAVRHHLAPRGYLFVNLPARMELYSNYDRVVGHRTRYDRRQLAAQLDAAGFDIVADAYWGLLFVPLLLARKASLAFKDPQSTDAVIRAGFRVPWGPLNHVLRWIGALEIKLCPRPPIGTSLLAVARARS